MVVRAQRPQLLPTYPLLLAAAPPFAAMLAVGAACEETGLVLAALTGLLVRLGVACSARSVAGESFAPARALAQAFLGDATLLVALAMALSTRRFTWRGRRLVLARGGALDVDASAPNASLGTELAS
jgi:ceramide glucosyltransferase